MSVPAGWNATAALAHLAFVPFQGSAWRFHSRKYLATDPAGSLKVSGRYHRGLDQFPPELVWPALYLALAPEICIGEILRHVSVELLSQLNDYRLTEIRVKLTIVLDCRDAAAMGLDAAALCGDSDYELTQDIATAAMDRGAEGILMPSATRLGDNLIVFPSISHSWARLEIVGSRDPLLYVPR